MKQLHHSLTIWINFIILVLSIFDTHFFDSLGLSEHTTLIITSILVKVVAIANIALRLFTNTPINANIKPKK